MKRSTTPSVSPFLSLFLRSSRKWETSFLIGLIIFSLWSLSTASVSDYGLKKFFGLSIYDCEVTGTFLKGRPCASQGVSLDYKSVFDTVIISADNGIFFYNVSNLFQIDYVGSVNFSCDFSFDGIEEESIVYATHDKGLCQCDQPGEAPCPVQLQVSDQSAPTDVLASMNFGEFSEAPVSNMNTTISGPLIMGEDLVTIGAASPSYFGCGEFTPELRQAIQSTSNSLLVIYRGECRFQDKVDKAQAVGASALVIVNNEGALTPTLGWKIDKYSLPVIIVSYADFAPLAEKLRAKIPLRGEFGPKIGAYFVTSNTRPSMGIVTIDTQAHNISSSSKKFFRYSYDVLIDKLQKMAVILFPDSHDNKITILDVKDSLNPKLLKTYVDKIDGKSVLEEDDGYFIFYQNNRSILGVSDPDALKITYFLISPQGELSYMAEDDVSQYFLNPDGALPRLFTVESKLNDIFIIHSNDVNGAPNIRFFDASTIGNLTLISLINETNIFESNGGQRYEDLEIKNNLFLAFARSEGIQLYDIKDIKNPVLIGNLDTSSDLSLTTGAIAGAFHKNPKYIFVINSSGRGVIEMMLVANDSEPHPQPKRQDRDLQAQEMSNSAENVIGLDLRSDTTSKASKKPTNSTSLGVIKIRAGATFSCALFETQVVRCWGNNNYGQLGIGSRKAQGLRSSITQGVQLGDYASISDISTGYRHACAVLNPNGKLISATRKNKVDNSNQLICWGWGNAGQLGYGTLESVGDDSSPVDSGFINFPDAEIVKVEVGMYHSCGIVLKKKNDTLDDMRAIRCWGLNSNGQLGYGDIFSKINASEVGDIQFPTNSTPKWITLGAYHTCALFENGEVYCWGLSSSGQLGQVDDIDNEAVGDIGADLDTLPLQSSAVKLPGKAIQIAAGNLHTCALLVNGSVSCWGSDLSGQLGFNSNRNKVETPSSFVDLPYPAISISAGNFHTCAVFDPTTTKGINFRCWGRGDHGQLGISAAAAKGDSLSSPEWELLSDFPKIVQISAGESHTCALTVDRKVRCWGNSQDGYLGYPVDINVGDGIKITDGDEVAFDYELISISAGHSHTCALVQPGSVRCWGSGIDGKLGYGNIDDQGSILPASSTINIQLDNLVDSIALGFKHTCVLTTNQAVTCWGDSSYGQLGRGNRESIGSSRLPTVFGYIPLDENVTLIAAGAFHTCAVLQSGNIRCWGMSLYGQIPNIDLFEKDLGDDEKVTSVPALDVFNGMVIQDIRAGAFHTCILVKRGEDGKVVCWGLAFNGRLGYGDVYQREVVVEVTNDSFVDLGGHSAEQISCGFEHTCALLKGGKVICWGSNFYGQLGYGIPEDIGDDETPAHVGPIPLEEKVVQVAAGGSHTCVLFVSGQVKCWGYGNFGQLGHGTTQSFGKLVRAIDVPVVPIVEGQNVSFISAGMYHTCVITNKELFKCWGDGSAGKLGFGNYVNVGSTNESLSLPFLSLSCGDGAESAFEECDDGNLVNGDGCSKYCLIEPFWICSPSPGGLTRCSKCGNYFTELLEECDDGNTESYDGCSSECKIEDGWDCPFHIICEAICGDGKVVRGEACDIGPETKGPLALSKGCVRCSVVSGWNCTGEPSVCDTICGDGIIAGAEDCDPMSNNSAGCSNQCHALPGWTCNPREGCTFKVKDPDYVSWDSGSAIALIILNMIGVVLTATTMVFFFIFRAHKVIRAAHLIFCFITQFGILIGFFNVFLWVGYPTNTQCVLRPWFAAISFTLIFGPISAKTFAIWQIFSNNNLEHSLTWNRLLGHFATVLSLFMIILICWTAIDPLEPAVFDNHFSDTKLVVRCDSSHRIAYVVFLFIIAGALMAYNVFLAFKTRNVIIQYNESKWIAVSIYNFAAWAIIVVVLAYALSRLPSAMFLILFLGVFFVLTSTLGLLFGSRIYVVYSESARTHDIKLGSTTGESSFRKPTLL